MTMTDIDAYPFEIHTLSPDDGGGYLISFSDFRWCIAEGESVEQAIANGRDKLQMTIAGLRNEGQSVPEPFSRRAIRTEILLQTLRPPPAPEPRPERSQREKVRCEPLTERRGILLFEFKTDTPFFRVQHRRGEEILHDDGDLTDYVIAHSDLEIEIVDDGDVAVYRRGDDLYIDHAPGTLGYEREDEQQETKNL